MLGFEVAISTIKSLYILHSPSETRITLSQMLYNYFQVTYGHYSLLCTTKVNVHFSHFHHDTKYIPTISLSSSIINVTYFVSF